MDLENKVAIVTGGAQGIGKEYTLSLLAYGCYVCVCDINEKAGRNFVEEASENFKDKLNFVKCDVSISEEFNDVFKKTSEAFGHIDILINNAGIMDEHNWMKMISINFIGVINGIQLAFQHMGVKNGGSVGFVINTASFLGITPSELCPIYCGCKHGIVGLTKSYGTDFHLNKTGITVNAICPRLVDTPLMQKFAKNSVCEETSKLMLSTKMPLKPSTVAAALIKLLHDRKNGALLLVDFHDTYYAS